MSRAEMTEEEWEWLTLMREHFGDPYMTLAFARKLRAHTARWDYRTPNPLPRAPDPARGDRRQIDPPDCAAD